MILGAFDGYEAAFRRLTRKARVRFEERDWAGAGRDAVERLELYSESLDQTLRELRELLGPRTRGRTTWRGLKASFQHLIRARADRELAETFFNSVTRRIFSTVGVDADVEFVHLAVPAKPASSPGVAELMPKEGSVEELVRAILARQGFSVEWEDLERDSRLVAAAVEARLGGRRATGLEVARPLFYRGRAAYLVGRVHAEGETAPLALALLNPEGRIVVDAALLDEDEVSIVFSYTRSYFRAECDRPGELVGFLHGILPRKPLSELYTSVGYNRHGKTEFYRELLRHLAATDEKFEVAPGDPGMVMLVFSLPSYDVVFKVIRDHFDEPKTTTRREVMERYRLVFRHDRAGRLVDAQEFEHLQFERERFSPRLIGELLAKAGGTVSADRSRVVLRHLYTERRVTPLNLFLARAGEEDARVAILDYGRALRDLAATNIFPGDLLPKNFGLTRHGRVVFYDYDELCLVTDCNFRPLPVSPDPEEETGGDWFYVGERDVFPEEFLTFLPFRGARRDLFLKHHGDLLTPEFWLRLQEEHRAGRVVDIFPYPPERRFAGSREDPSEKRRSP